MSSFVKDWLDGHGEGRAELEDVMASFVASNTARLLSLAAPFVRGEPMAEEEQRMIMRVEVETFLGLEALIRANPPAGLARCIDVLLTPGIFELFSFTQMVLDSHVRMVFADAEIGPNPALASLIDVLLAACDHRAHVAVSTLSTMHKECAAAAQRGSPLGSPLVWDILVSLLERSHSKPIGSPRGEAKLGSYSLFWADSQKVGQYVLDVLAQLAPPDSPSIVARLTLLAGSTMNFSISTLLGNIVGPDHVPLLGSVLLRRELIFVRNHLYGFLGRSLPGPDPRVDWDSLVDRANDPRVRKTRSHVPGLLVQALPPLEDASPVLSACTPDSATRFWASRITARRAFPALDLAAATCPLLARRMLEGIAAYEPYLLDQAQAISSGKSGAAIALTVSALCMLMARGSLDAREGVVLPTSDPCFPSGPLVVDAPPASRAIVASDTSHLLGRMQERTAELDVRGMGSPWAPQTWSSGPHNGSPHGVLLEAVSSAIFVAGAYNHIATVSHALEVWDSVVGHDPRLAEYGLDAVGILNTPDVWTGIGALHSVAQEGHPDAAKSLIDMGSHIDAVSALDDGTTPLMLAAESGRERTVRVLVQSGADVNRVDGAGNTALRLALIQMHYDVVHTLVVAGAQPIKSHAEEAQSKLRVSNYLNHPRVPQFRVSPVTRSTLVQNDLTARMRMVVIGWLAELISEYELKLKNLFFAVNYLDRYLSANRVTRKTLQLVGVVSMHISTMQTHGNRIDMEDCVYLCDGLYAMDEAEAMRDAMMDVLNTDGAGGVKPVIGLTYLNSYIVMVGLDLANMTPSLSIPGSSLSTVRVDPIEYQRADIMYLSSFLAELTLLEYRFLFYAPDVLAAAIVRYSMYLLGHPEWPPYAQRFSGFAPGHEAFDSCFATLRLLVQKFSTYISARPGSPLITRPRHPRYVAIAAKYPLLGSLNVHLHVREPVYCVAPQA